MSISPKLLFNPEANDIQKLIYKGQTTNTFNLFDIKYKWAYNEIFPTMLENHWIPEKSGMSNDKLAYEKDLNEQERQAFLKILSFLIYLDSLQTNNIGNISDYITAPEVVLCLARQTFDEALHSRSYGYILTSIFDREVAIKAIYYWKDDQVLLERNKYIAQIYQDFKDNPSDDGFVKVLVANFLLEGLYFYNGFQFFYNLASRGLMIDTSTQIKYINRDELVHCNLFKNIILEFQKENTELWERNAPEIENIFKNAVEQEIAFSTHIIGDNILGMNTDSIKQYSYWLANHRLSQLKLKPLFEKTQNPYKHLQNIAGVEDEASNKTNVFEAKSIAYKQSSILSGWDAI